MNITIQKIKDNLATFNSENTVIKQLGFLETNFEIKNFEYKMEYEFLKIYNKNNEVFIKFNINQIYNIIYTQEKLELYLDNDTIITIEIKR